jgi:tripartite-type tricarboxylate transporter receptor subunit TctC
MTWSSAIGQIRPGAVVPIAVSSATRIADFPDVPTLREEGYDLVALTWYALSGPAGLPNGIVDKLNRAVNEAWATPQLKRRLADDVILAEPMTAEQITAYMASEVRKWGPLARRVVPSQ